MAILQSESRKESRSIYAKRNKGGRKTVVKPHLEATPDSSGNTGKPPQHTTDSEPSSEDDTTTRDRHHGTTSLVPSPNTTHFNFHEFKSKNEQEPSILSSASSSGSDSDSTSSSESDAEAIRFKNIIIPPEEISGTGPLRRQQVRPKSGKPSVLPSTNPPEKKDDQRDQPRTIGKRTAAPITSAGPDALDMLRSMIPQYLLSRLPGFDSLEFSTHTKGTGYALLQLLLGVCGSQEMSKWQNSVYAYLRPHVNPSIGPALQMEVESAYEKDGCNLAVVDWEKDINTGRVELHGAFRETDSRQQLYTVIKYYFLLATEQAQDGFEHQFIPVNRTFFAHLEAICRSWGARDSPLEEIPEEWEYEDEYATPQYLSRKDNQRRRRVLSELPGVAKVVRESSKDLDLDVNKENDDRIRQRTSSPLLRLKKRVSDSPGTKTSVYQQDQGVHDELRSGGNVKSLSQTIESRSPGSKPVPPRREKWRHHPCIPSAGSSNGGQSPLSFAPDFVGMVLSPGTFATGTSSIFRKDSRSEVDGGFTRFGENNSRRLRIDVSRVAHNGRGRSSQHYQYSLSKIRRKLRSSVSPPVNPLESRRPPPTPTEDASSMSLKQQRKTASGRIEKPRRASKKS